MAFSKYIVLSVFFSLLCCSNMSYADNNSQNFDAFLNMTIGAVDNDKIYQRFAKGQCTWYAWGRFREVHKKKIRFKRKMGVDAKLWPELIVNCKVDSQLTEKSIAVSESGRYGHLIFIEHIEGSTIYYTEANGDGNGLYDRGIDCVLKKVELDDEFMRRFRWFVHP